MTAALIATLLCAASPGAAAPAPAAALARKVQAFYEQTRDLQAGFTQTYRYALAGRSQTSKGTLRVKKPGKLRWDYTSPTPKTVVVNGSRLVQYEPEEGQAYVDEHFDASAMSAAVTFLLGQGSLEKEFELGIEGADKLVLTPRRPDPRVQRVVLTVGAEGEVTGTRVEDGQGNVNDLAFTAIQRNPGLADAVFVLDLPKDVRRLKMPGR